MFHELEVPTQQGAHYHRELLAISERLPEVPSMVFRALAEKFGTPVMGQDLLPIISPYSPRYLAIFFKKIRICLPSEFALYTIEKHGNGQEKKGAFFSDYLLETRRDFGAVFTPNFFPDPEEYPSESQEFITQCHEVKVINDKELKAKFTRLELEIIKDLSKQMGREVEFESIETKFGLNRSTLNTHIKSLRAKLPKGFQIYTLSNRGRYVLEKTLPTSTQYEPRNLGEVMNTYPVEFQPLIRECHTYEVRNEKKMSSPFSSEEVCVLETLAQNAPNTVSHQNLENLFHPFQDVVFDVNIRMALQARIIGLRKKMSTYSPNYRIGVKRLSGYFLEKVS